MANANPQTVLFEVISLLKEDGTSVVRSGALAAVTRRSSASIF